MGSGVIMVVDMVQKVVVDIPRMGKAPITFIINYYENYVIISFLFTYLYYGSSHHIPPYFFYHMNDKKI